MKPFKCYSIIGTIFVLITGTLAHFLYEWTGNNPVIGLFTPVNESIWEHMKLLFFPMLLWTVLMCVRFRREYPCITPSFCLGIVIGTALIPVFFYAYTWLLGKDIFILDIATFLLSVLIAFWLSYRLTLSCRLTQGTFFWCCLVGVLFACFCLFTYEPPKLGIFAEPAITFSTPTPIQTA